MAAGDRYRTLANNCLALAKVARSEIAKQDLMHLARTYLRLAEQADQNALNDLVYETPDRQRVRQQEKQHDISHKTSEHDNPRTIDD
jgi:glutamate/tyrosine decarboxylase-like PLP-dependent enzyme